MNKSRNVPTRMVVLAGILGASTMAHAQYPDSSPRWGRPNTPRSGACFYRDPAFRGPYFCANSGENIALLSRGMNDQISSIRAFGDTEVTIFQDPRFQGRWTRLEGDVWNLRNEGWNDRLSSIWVSPGYGDGYNRGQRPYEGHPRRPGIGMIETGEWRDDPAAGRDGVRVYRDDPPNRRDGANGYGNEPAQSRGGSGPGRNDPTDRRGSPGVDRPEGADPRGDAPGSQRPGDATDSIVRHAYQDILGREPDVPGLTLYRNRMNNENWSEQDVREALLKSPEYRQRTALTPLKNAEALVARAYRSVLGREPDPASRVYVDKVLREHWTEADVSRELRDSPEYRSKHP